MISDQVILTQISHSAATWRSTMWGYSPFLGLCPECWSLTPRAPRKHSRHSGSSGTDSKIFHSAAAQTSTQSVASQKQTSNALSSWPRPHSTCPSSNPSSMPRRRPNLNLSLPTIHSPMKQVGLSVIQSISTEACSSMNQIWAWPTPSSLSMAIWGKRISSGRMEHGRNCFISEATRWVRNRYMKRLNGSSGAIQLVRDSILYLYSLIPSKQNLAALLASILQDTYTCYDQLLCKGADCLPRPT